METMFIKKVLINNLWDKFQIDWTLNSDVNILIGKNGTGKSTILDLIEAVIKQNSEQLNKYVFNKINIKFNNKRAITLSRNSINLSDKYNKDEIEKMFELLKKDIFLKLEKNEKIDDIIKEEVKEDIKEEEEKEDEENLPDIIKISTFDMELQNKKAIKNSGEKSSIQTELDLMLFDLINDFKLFQLKLKNKVEEESKKIDDEIKALTGKENELSKLKILVHEKEEKVNLIFEHKDKFITIVNKLFSNTNKLLKLDENNSIIFEYNNNTISPYQLSSGEKQILMILLTIILQENKPFILLMDEPEISLHVEWQKEFLDSLTSLNSKMQIILATHSPAIVSKGWKDKVIKISDIVSEA